MAELGQGENINLNNFDAPLDRPISIPEIEIDINGAQSISGVAESELDEIAAGIDISTQPSEDVDVEHEKGETGY